MQVNPGQPARRRVRGWDVALTSVLLVVMLGAAAIASVMGMFLAMASDSCSVATRCSTNLIEVGVLAATIGPWVVGVIAFVTGVALLLLRRPAYWVPLIALPLIAAPWGVGAWIVALGTTS